ncbi:hypothetical protein BGZ97_012533 [Linnemannia gamsii]|jgi:hypothetical protein|uniref:Chromo domain-containing protein n=1 Tax=Linnemannia gamsii TaxID=64522 RepID=A0A9P6ULM8_9FUNG|nr:hypothetical protein BGZ97_012533 [Linnemannia gamsii]
MDGTHVKKEPSDDRSSAVLIGLSSKDKEKHRNKAESKKKRANGSASGTDDTSDLDTPGSNSDNSGDSDSDIEEESDVFEVEKVVGHRYDHQNTLSYHIKWKGYSDEESTWEHESQVFCVDMVKDYWKQYVEQGGNRSDLQGTITRPTSSSLSLNGRRKSTTFSTTLSGNKHGTSNNSSKGDKAGGKAGGGKGGSGGRSGRISPEPLLPDLSPLVKSSAAVAVATGAMTATTTTSTTTTTTATTGATKPTSSKRARTRSPERQLSTLQSSQKDTNTFAVPTTTGSNKSWTPSTATKMAKVTSESRKGVSALATGGATTTTELHQQSRDNAPPRKLTAVGPVLITEENWTPPSHWDSWDSYVERVEAIETRSADRHDRSTMFVHLRWKNGNRLTLHPLQEIHDKAPRRLIDFYEGHLQFQESG